jgi:hypothetical protein
MKRVLSYASGIVSRLAVLGSAVAAFWDEQNEKTHFDPVVP